MSSATTSRTAPDSGQWLRRALGMRAEDSPFPWQLRLLKSFLEGKRIEALDIPTGLGKTATMAIWLVAKACGAKIPRRLVYVVDNRAVVDQASEVAESLRDWVANEPDAATALGLQDRNLPISTLRGQHVDNRAWLEDPSSPAIIVGTVDMVGSRLLFSGYGVSARMRPFHAGLLGADTIVVLDEAHLAPAFEDLLRQIVRGTEAFAPPDQSLRELVPPLWLLSLSATGRQTEAKTLTLSEDDRSNPIVHRRLTGRKALRILDVADIAETTTVDDGRNAAITGAPLKKNRGTKLAGVLAKQAWALSSQSGEPVRCLVFCNARKDATAVAAELRNLAKAAGQDEPNIELLVGGRRIRERTQARDALAKLGFLAGTTAKVGHSAFLIATSAGEVGVDLDADHMACDLVSWERMVQRLGRVNRRGEGDAQVVVVVGPEPVPTDAVTKALEKRHACHQAKAELAELTRALKVLQSGHPATSKGRKKSADDRSAAANREQAAKELKSSITACRKRINAFKDADARLAGAHEATLQQHRALRRLLAAVGENGDLSPAALLTLRQREDLGDTLRTATSVEPLRPELTRALVEAWSMTSLEEHPGRPEVAPWLRGFRPDEPPRTNVAWRRHLPVRQDGHIDGKAAKRFFEAAPIHASELLETETHHVLDWLIERAATACKAKGESAALRAEQVVAIAVGPSGEPRGWRSVEQLAAAKSKDNIARDQGIKELGKLLSGATLVVDSRLGGLSDGLLSEQTDAIAQASDDGAATWLVRPGATDVPVTGFRIRELTCNTDDGVAPQRITDGWLQRHLFVTRVVDGEPASVLAIEGWAEEAATEEGRAASETEQQLSEHQGWAEECAKDIAARIGLDASHADLLALAARLHDEGKRASRWQAAFKAPIPGRPYAKARGPIDFELLDGYRHELGSLPYVEADEGFKRLSENEQELVLHLIAAHHGFARPLIGTSGCDDAPPSLVEARARAAALRFAQLTKRWGPWGLAWWEALLRAADQLASRRHQQASTAQRGRP